LTFVLDGGNWSASRPGCFNPRWRALCTHWLWRWVGSRAGLDTVEYRKISCRCRELNPESSAVQLVAIPIQLSRPIENIKLDLKYKEWNKWTGSCWIRLSLMKGCCEQGDE
jgi:hypothetical protein